jgi:hypothetical protein
VGVTKTIRMAGYFTKKVFFHNSVICKANFIRLTEEINENFDRRRPRYVKGYSGSVSRK